MLKRKSIIAQRHIYVNIFFIFFQEEPFWEGMVKIGPESTLSRQGHGRSAIRVSSDLWREGPELATAQGREGTEELEAFILHADSARRLSEKFLPGHCDPALARTRNTSQAEACGYLYCYEIASLRLAPFDKLRTSRTGVPSVEVLRAPAMTMMMVYSTIA